MSNESTALLVGGSSEIGIAVLKQLLGPPPRTVVLAGRPSRLLRRNADQLRDRGYSVTTVQYDASYPVTDIDALLDHLCADIPLGLAVVAVGSLSETSFADGVIVNGLAVALLVHSLVNRLRTARSGQLVLLSSAAAVRPRREIAAYSVGKQLADSTAQLLAAEAADDGVRLLIVRPGFVTTRMTCGLRKPPLWTTPEMVARAVVRALRGRQVVAWAPRSMVLAIWVLRRVPQRLLPDALR